MALNIPERKIESIAFGVSDNVIRFSGELDLFEEHKAIDSFFDSIVSVYKDPLVIDLKDLHFINSSGINCFINFIFKSNPELEVHILFNPAIRWQSKAIPVFLQMGFSHIKCSETGA